MREELEEDTGDVKFSLIFHLVCPDNTSYITGSLLSNPVDDSWTLSFSDEYGNASSIEKSYITPRINSLIVWLLPFSSIYSDSTDEKLYTFSPSKYDCGFCPLLAITNWLIFRFLNKISSSPINNLPDSPCHPAVEKTLIFLFSVKLPGRFLVRTVSDATRNSPITVSGARITS